MYLVIEWFSCDATQRTNKMPEGGEGMAPSLRLARYLLRVYVFTLYGTNM